ncbi:MAG: hypothetical protein LIR10_04800 [Bacillota bacterium]|nr:hypothetical protein [Bacillota bacterium]
MLVKLQRILKLPSGSKKNLFYFAYLAFLIRSIIGTTEFSTIPELHMPLITRVLYVITVLLLLYKEASNFKWQKETLFWGSILLVSLLVTYQAKTIDIFASVLLIASARDQDINVIFKIFIFTIVTIVSYTILSSLIGIIPNGDFSSVSSTGVFRSRFTLGFTWMTFSAQMLFYTVAAIVIVYRNKLNMLSYFLLLTVVYWIYAQTATRNPFILATILIVGAIIYQYVKPELLNNRFVFWCAVLVYPATALVSIFFTAIYHAGGALEILNKLLSERLKFGQYFLHEYGFSLFGQKFDVTFDVAGMGTISLDSSYLRYAICFGIVFTLLLIIGFAIIPFNYADNGVMLLCLLAIGIHSLVDPQLFAFGYTPFPLLLSQSYKLLAKFKKRRRLVHTKLKD